jgi:hypothetical protein
MAFDPFTSKDGTSWPLQQKHSWALHSYYPNSDLFEDLKKFQLVCINYKRPMSASIFVPSVVKGHNKKPQEAMRQL